MGDAEEVLSLSGYEMEMYSAARDGENDGPRFGSRGMGGANVAVAAFFRRINDTEHHFQLVCVRAPSIGRH